MQASFFPSFSCCSFVLFTPSLIVFQDNDDDVIGRFFVSAGTGAQDRRQVQGGGFSLKF